jgi:hypothetical protein
MNENKNKGKIKLTKTFAAPLLFLAGFILASTSCTKKEEKLFFQVSKDTVSVYGYVKDYAGNPIADAEITILPTGDKIKSEKDGLYRFSVGLGELPQDAFITYEVQKEGFVKSRVSVSFAEILFGTNNDVAVQKRVRRQDVVLFPPAEIEVEVVDKDNKPVAGSRVLAFPSPQIALYLGVSLNEAVASVTSQTTPVKITSVIPAIDSIQLVAFPPQGAEEDYDVSAASVDVSQIKAKGKVVLTLKPLEIIYSSVAVGQYISPDDKIKLIFSKEITGIDATLICGLNNININAKISGAEVEIEPAGRILGNCNLIVNNAFGKKGETLPGIFFFSFIAYDPTAPRGLACPKINPYLQGSVTGVTFDFDVIADRTLAVYYSPNPESFDGFQTTTTNLVNLIWDPPVVPGIKNYKIKYLKLSDKLKGSGIWQELPPPPAVRIQFIPKLNKWIAFLDLNFIPQFNTSFGEKYYLAVVPVNLNDEEICNPETIENPFTIQDNTSPKITQCQIIAGPPPDPTIYIPGERTVLIQFSEMITFATATISSRNFDAVKISEVFDPLLDPSILITRVYLEALSAKVPSDAENSNGDEKLLLPNDEAKKLWVGEFVRVKRSDGSTAFPGPVTAIIGGLANSIVWFFGTIPGDVGNGVVEPQSTNSLQAPNNGALQVEDTAGKRLKVSSILHIIGLTIDDRIQVVDPYSNTRKILTIKSVVADIISFSGTITVAEDISDLKCVSTTGKQCIFRSFRPDVWVKVQAFDSSGNLIDFLADQCSIGPVPPAPVIW